MLDSCHFAYSLATNGGDGEGEGERERDNICNYMYIYIYISLYISLSLSVCVHIYVDDCRCIYASQLIFLCRASNIANVVQADLLPSSQVRGL